MMHNSVKELFFQLRELINKLSDQEYCQPIPSLSNNSIGQHVRHVLELFTCLLSGMDKGTVNYDNRKRDTQIEEQRNKAVELTDHILSRLIAKNKPLLLEVCYDTSSDKYQILDSNFYRELAYNIEHTIHHMALIRIGVETVSTIKLPSEFGVASSTVKFRMQCAQ